MYELIKGINIIAITNPSPMRIGRLINNIFISGTMRESTANIISNSINAVNIGAASFNPASYIAEPASITPSDKTAIVGMLPIGNAS